MLQRSDNRIVAFAQVAGDYNDAPVGLIGPEMPPSAINTIALQAVRHLLLAWGLDSTHAGTSGWNPLGDIVPPGARITIKPNWVYHEPRGPATLDCLITHTSVIQAVLEYLAITKPSSISIGDAPIQSCNFDILRERAGLHDLKSWARKRGIPLEIIDFRRTISPSGRPGGKRYEDVRSLDQFTLFDLGNDSWLQPLDRDAARLRVTGYDPDLLMASHHPGTHKYLIAREVLEADVVINLPKLKCHMKAGITGALKNLVGINGHKEYLPHHRKGGSGSNGDCYPGTPLWKRASEDIGDFLNRGRGFRPLRYVIGRVTSASRKLIAMSGADDNIEGSWYGNDTVWRTCLDLNRILMYGSPAGTIEAIPQRTVITITDAIVAGEASGPLRPTPVNAGFITGALNVAAADYLHARMMGFDPDKIPLVRNAFSRGSWPLADFGPEEIRARSPGRESPASAIRPIRHFVAPAGWRNHCELQSENADFEVDLARV